MERGSEKYQNYRNFFEAFVAFFENGGRGEKGGCKGRVVLDEMYFRNVEKFDGDNRWYRSFMFDLLVAVGRVDDRLNVELKRFCM